MLLQNGQVNTSGGVTLILLAMVHFQFIATKLELNGQNIYIYIYIYLCMVISIIQNTEHDKRPSSNIILYTLQKFILLNLLVSV